MPCRKMVSINNKLYISVTELSPWFSQASIWKHASEYRTGIKTAYANIPDPTDKRACLIEYASIPEATRVAKGMPTPAQLWQQYYLSLLPSLSPDEQARNYFEQHDDVKAWCQELAHIAAYLRYLADLSADNKLLKEAGWSRLGDLYNTALEVMNSQGWSTWKCSNAQVLKRKIRPFKGCLKTDNLSLHRALDTLRSNKVVAKIGNDNGRCLNDEQTSCIVTFYSNPGKPNKPTIQQTYDYYLRVASEKISCGEWHKRALVDYKTLVNLLNDPQIKQEYWAERHGGKAYHDRYAIVTKRRRASYANALWVIDGTPPHLYHLDPLAGMAAVRLNSFWIIDAHSWCILGFFIREGGESTGMVLGALRAACMLSGFMPHQIQYDNSSAITSWHAQHAIKAISAIQTPAAVGNARSKVIEPFFHQLNQRVMSTFPNYTGNPFARKLDNQANREGLAELVRLKDMPLIDEAVRQLHLIASIWNNLPARKSGKDPLSIYKESVAATLDKQRKYSATIELDAFWTMPGKMKQVPIMEAGRKRMVSTFLPDDKTYRADGINLMIEGRKYEFIVDDVAFNSRYIGQQFQVKYDPMEPERGLYLYRNGQPFLFNNKHMMLSEQYRYAQAIADREDGECKRLHEHLGKKKLQKAEAKERLNARKQQAITQGTYMPFITANAFDKEVLAAGRAQIQQGIVHGEAHKLTDDVKTNTVKTSRGLDRLADYYDNDIKTKE